MTNSSGTHHRYPKKSKSIRKMSEQERIKFFTRQENKKRK